jgi:hypothetical protein
MKLGGNFTDFLNVAGDRIYQMAIIYVYQNLPPQDLSKFTEIWMLGMYIYCLAAQRGVF